MFLKSWRNRGNHGRVWLAVLGLLLAASTAFAADEKPHVFEKAIQKFEATDAKSPPVDHPILFVGSSSIVRWKLDKSFPDLPVLNRGFGGSRIADSVYFFDRVVRKYKPRLIVFYAGDNDLAGGLTPEAVLADFQTLAAKVHAELPGTPLVYVSIKPSIARWKLIDAVRKTNGLIKKSIESDPLVTFVDVEPAMLGPDGQPMKELFVADGLHLSPKGYELWTALVKPHLK
jgi:lysophospholipase L1-like esterase